MRCDPGILQCCRRPSCGCLTSIPKPSAGRRSLIVLLSRSRRARMRDPLQLTPESLYIDGKWRAPAGGGRLWPVVNPATEVAVTQVALGCESDVDSAVD